MPNPDPFADGPLLFVGDSITEQWSRHRPFFFADRGFVNRGVGGQCTRDMRARFDEEMRLARPSGVHLMGGINDIAGNGWPVPLSSTQDELAWMMDRAAEAGCRVLVASVTPAARIGWNPKVQPAGPVLELNGWLREQARARRASYVDYHAVLRTSAGGLRDGLGPDGVHLDARGYRLIEPVLLDAIARCYGVPAPVTRSWRRRARGLLAALRR